MAVSRPRRACPLFSITTNSNPLSTLSPTETSEVNVPATSSWSLPYEYNFLEALLNTHFTFWAFKYFHTNLLFSQEFCHHLKHLNHLICQMHTHSCHSADLRLTLALNDGVYYPFLHCLPYAFLRLQPWPLLCFLFVLDTASKCPVPLQILNCFSPTGHRWSLALCPTFPQQQHSLCSCQFFVIHLSTHTICLVTRIACSFDWTCLFFRFFHSKAWIKLINNLITNLLLHNVCISEFTCLAVCLNLDANCWTVSLASWLVSGKQSLSYGTFACGFKYLFKVVVAFR